MDKVPIPWSSIQRYTEVNKRLDSFVFKSIIRSMDDAYLSHKGGESQTFTREMFKR